MKDNDQKRIVIVGGGLGGLMLATRLGQFYRRTDAVEVCLIDRASVHVWKPMLHKFAAGTAHAHNDGVPMIAQARRAGFSYYPGEMFALDPKARQISIRISDLPGGALPEHHLSYDLAVLAIGSGANDFGVPGIAEHCHFLDTLWRAEALNGAIRAEIVRRLITGGDIRIAVVGGGATGVEFAAEIARLVEIGASYGAADLPERLKVTLLDSGSRLLAGFPEDVAVDVTGKLTELGVCLKFDARVVSADPNGFTLTDGQRVDAAIMVWAAGVKAPEVLNTVKGVERLPTGQLAVDERLQVQGAEELFALGDCAALTPAGSDRPLPSTGQVARQQAAYLASAIPERMANRHVRAFAYRDMGTLVSLSQYGAFGHLAKRGVLPAIALKGWLARMAHHAFYRMHQIGLSGGLRGGVAMLRDGLDSLIKPDIRLD